MASARPPREVLLVDGSDNTEQQLGPPGVCKVPDDFFDGHMRVVQDTPADSGEPRMPTTVELADAARDDPELMASVSAKVGDGVGLLFTENGQQVPQEAFEQLAADFAASGQKMIGLPATMITSNASVREARISLEKQTGVYIPDEDDPLDMAPTRKYSLANQIRLLRHLAFVRNAPRDVPWIDYISRPDVRSRLDEIAAELGIHPGPDANIHRPRRLLCHTVSRQMEAEKKDPSIETVEAKLERLEKIEAQTNRLVYAFVQEKVRRETEAKEFTKNLYSAASSMVAAAKSGDATTADAEAALASCIDPNGGGRGSEYVMVSNDMILKEKQRHEKRKQKNSKRRQLAREAAFRKAIEKGDKQLPRVPDFSLKELESEMFDFDAVKKMTDKMIAHYDKDHLKKMVQEMVNNPDLENVEDGLRQLATELKKEE